MAKVTMTLTGMERLQEALATAPRTMEEGVAAAVQKTAFAVAARAKALVPVRTGALKAAITAVSRGTSGRVGVDAGGGGLPAIYWRYVEFGTRYQAARPYFRPAAEAEANPYIERLRLVGQTLERDLSSSSLV